MKQLRGGKPLITTIIPTFRRPKRLQQAIQTVLNQTFQEIKICVYDNASGDETRNIVEQFQDARIEYYCHENNIGAAENFEFGMLRVDTPFFSFLSDDDLLLPDFYMNAMEGFKEYPEAGFSAGRVTDVDEDGSVISISKKPACEREYRLPPVGLYDLILNYINWTGIVFRKEVITSLDREVKPIDVDFVLRCAARFPYVVSQKNHAIFVHHLTSYSGNCGLKLVWPSWMKILENLKKIVKDHEKIEFLMKRKLGMLLTSIGTQSILNKRENEVVEISDLLRGFSLVSFKCKIMKKVIALYKKFPILRSSIAKLLKPTYQLYKTIR